MSVERDDTDTLCNLASDCIRMLSMLHEERRHDLEAISACLCANIPAVTCPTLKLIEDMRTVSRRVLAQLAELERTGS